MSMQQSVKSRVYEGILNDIMDGVYPTDAVLNERKLTEQYQASKTAVREALALLCGEGVLNNIPRYGYQLTSITPREIIEIIEYRKAIELSALELSYPLIDAGKLAELSRMNAESKEIADREDSLEHWKHNLEFHRRLCGFCQNRYLALALETAFSVCTRVSHQYFAKLWRESKISDAENHVALTRALEARDLALAKSILATDVESFKNEILI